MAKMKSKTKRNFEEEERQIEERKQRSAEALRKLQKLAKERS
jgi:hypothetical protein